MKLGKILGSGMFNLKIFFKSSIKELKMSLNGRGEARRGEGEEGRETSGKTVVY